MPYVEKQIEKKYWTIGEVAEMVGVETHLIRKWTKDFRIGVKRSAKTSYRRYTMREIRLLKVIWYLRRVEGYSIKGVERQLLLNLPHWNKQVKFRFMNAA